MAGIAFNISNKVQKWGSFLGLSSFEKDGTYVATGEATTWRDIDFPIVIRTVAANFPTLQTLQGNIQAPQWDVNDYVNCEGQELVHQWKEGSEVFWHIHVTTNGLDTTNRYVKFQIEYTWVNVNGQLNTNTTVSNELLIPANTPDRTMFIGSISSFVPTGGRIGGHVFARLTRIASTGTAPTGNPFCSMLQLHIETDTMGSRNRTTK